MNRNMEAGIYTWFGFRYPFPELVRLIKGAGFRYVMTWWGDEYREEHGPKELEPDIIRNCGLILENTHLSFAGANAIWEDNSDGQEIFNKYFSYINDCRTYGIPKAIMHVSSGNNPPPFGQTGLDRFKRLTELAEKNNVIIALENLRKPEYLDFIFSNIESDKLKFCYDSGHGHCFTPGTNVLEKFGDKLTALHLHDNDGGSDQHVLPFDGTINWKQVMTQLDELGYDGPLSLEIDAQYIDVSKKFTAQEYLAEAMNRVRRLMSL